MLSRDDALLGLDRGVRPSEHVQEHQLEVASIVVVVRQGATVILAERLPFKGGAIKCFGYYRAFNVLQLASCRFSKPLLGGIEITAPSDPRYSCHQPNTLSLEVSLALERADGKAAAVARFYEENKVPSWGAQRDGEACNPYVDKDSPEACTYTAEWRDDGTHVATPMTALFSFQARLTIQYQAPHWRTSSRIGEQQDDSSDDEFVLRACDCFVSALRITASGKDERDASIPGWCYDDRDLDGPLFLHASRDLPWR